MVSGSPALPILDLAPLRQGGAASELVERLRSACREHGFFYLAGHGISADLLLELERLSRRFFALPLETKLAVRMSLGGRAWRGYFPVGGELTSGLPDQKEGLYLGEELPDDDARVRAGTPLHGANLWPSQPIGLREVVLPYLKAMTALSQDVMSLLALSLGLDAQFFRSGLTRDPLILFRIFHYPALPGAAFHAPTPVWSVGEHTDYGLLTLLWQDDCGGLQVKTPSGWIDAPPIPGTFVCNLGDMLDRLTCGHYRSTPHRVLNQSGRDRLSLPFFFDPGFDAEVAPIDPSGAQKLDDDWQQRWDRSSVHAFRGRYGDYVQSKVAKVFPELWQDIR